MGFYYNNVEYRHKYHNRQYISIRKNSCSIAYMTASLTETPSVTSGLRVLVQPTKPDFPIKFLYEELLNVYVFSARKMFRTFCVPLCNRISHFKILAMP